METTMPYNCEKCSYVFGGRAIVNSEGDPVDAVTYPYCPRCGNKTGKKQLLEQIRKVTGDPNAQLLE